MVFVEDMLKEVPPVTKALCGSTAILQLLVYVNAISKYDLYFNLNLILSKFQVQKN